MQNKDLSDQAAMAECRRLLMVISAQRRVQDQWFGNDTSNTIEFDENSAFCMGMLSLFRYARGQNVPAPIVQSFRDELLKLLFCGLASNTLVMPSFARMADRPWAHALRLAELRLAFEGEEEIDYDRLAHLLGLKLPLLFDRLGISPRLGRDIVDDVLLSRLLESTELV